MSNRPRPATLALRYYSRDYGWRTLEHEHVVTLTHHPDGRESMQCLCGAKTAKLGKVGNWIKEHRRLMFGIA